MSAPVVAAASAAAARVVTDRNLASFTAPGWQSQPGAVNVLMPGRLGR